MNQSGFKNRKFCDDEQVVNKRQIFDAPAPIILAREYKVKRNFLCGFTKAYPGDPNSGLRRIYFNYEVLEPFSRYFASILIYLGNFKQLGGKIVKTTKIVQGARNLMKI